MKNETRQNTDFFPTADLTDAELCAKCVTLGPSSVLTHWWVKDSSPSLHLLSFAAAHQMEEHHFDRTCKIMDEFVSDYEALPLWRPCGWRPPNRKRETDSGQQMATRLHRGSFRSLKYFPPISNFHHTALKRRKAVFGHALFHRSKNVMVITCQVLLKCSATFPGKPPTAFSLEVQWEFRMN